MLGLAAILSLGCGDSPLAPDEPATGAIQVSVSNAQSRGPFDSYPDGYTVAIDDGPSRPLNPYAQLTFGDIGAGSHLVRLGDVLSNCSAGTNPRSVEVAPTRDADTVHVHFEVSCGPKTGTIQVTTTTVGEDQDADGYIVEIDGQGKGRVPANGTISVEAVREGEWPVSLTDMSRNCKVQGTYPAAANVPFGGTVQVALTVRCVAAGSLVVTTVVTGDDYPLSGYDLTVYQVDGGTSTAARVPTNGSLTIPGAPGQYRLFLTVAPNCVLVPPNPIVAVVLVGALTPVTFGVVCDGPRRIALVGESGKGADIYVVYSNGTDSKQITTATGADLDPAWSPDGSKIAFASERDGNFEIYSMGSSGENPVRLTQNSASDFRPAWSPDGSRIAFVSNRDGNSEIYVMNADGTNQARLTNNDASDSDPDWSPDGTRIAFSSEREIGGIWVMSADGSDPHRLTSNSSGDYQPAWSPDGSRLAFSHGVSATSRDIYFVSSDGSSVVPFISDLGNATDPSWSPDGRYLAFSTFQCGWSWYYDELCEYRLQIMSADGKRGLSISQLNESNPAYQP
jgi:Tol biopolymer transport system component